VLTVEACEVQVGDGLVIDGGGVASRVTAVRPHGESVVIVTKSGTTLWGTHQLVRVVR
jgi:hypothetical protein